MSAFRVDECLVLAHPLVGLQPANSPNSMRAHSVYAIIQHIRNALQLHKSVCDER